MQKATKVCSLCRTEKLTSCYHKDKGTADGYYPRCKECRGFKVKVLVCKCCGKDFERTGPGRDPLFCRECKKTAMRPCEECGQEIPVAKKHRFCSQVCASKYAGRQPRGGLTVYKKTCLHCGANFERLSNGKNQSFCSVACRGASQRTLKGTTRECVICGNIFEPTHKETKCCSSKCQAVVSNRRLVEKLAKTTQICKECGKEYTPLRTNQIYCDKNCRDRVYARNNPDYTSAKGHRYRSRLAAVEHEEIIASEIYERDRWRCGICGKKVNKKLRHPDPLSPTLDHIIPLSLGGPHMKDNVQLAHYVCNITKGNRNIMPNDKGQLMLV